MSLSDRIRARLRKDRPMTTISMRIPMDVIEDLKAIAPTLGFAGYQPLIRAYIGQGLRRDLAELAHGDPAAIGQPTPGRPEGAKLKLHVVLEDDETGMVVAECQEMPGCIAQGTNDSGQEV